MGKFAIKEKNLLLPIATILCGLSYIVSVYLLILVIVVWGLFNLKEEDYVYAALLFILGGIFLVDRIFSLGLTEILIGLFIVGLGIYMLFDDSFKKSKR